MECSYCGNPDAPVVNQEGTEFYCLRCKDLFGTCAMCVNAEICPFQTSDIDIPPIVMQTIRQGPVTMQQQIKNPDRIRETCQKLCPCFHEEFACLKENGTCGNYARRLPNRTEENA